MITVIIYLSLCVQWEYMYIVYNKIRHRFAVCDVNKASPSGPLSSSCADPEGGRGTPPLKNHKKYRISLQSWPGSPEK